MSDQTAMVQNKEIEQVLVNGDLSALTPDQRLSYYMTVCKSLGLNPLTKPFDYLKLSGKLTLYANKDCASQLRTIRKVSITKIEAQIISGVYIVTAYAQTPDGRIDTSTGVVSIDNKRGDDLANAMMKAETKAKRRATLSICGLGMLDESEIETISDAKIVNPQIESGSEPEHQEQSKAGPRPYSPETVKAGIVDKVKRYLSLGNTATEKQRNLARIMLVTTSGNDDLKRYAVTKYLTGVSSTKELSDPYVLALLDWFKPVETADGYVPNEYALKEWNAILEQVYVDQGQQSFIDPQVGQP